MIARPAVELPEKGRYSYEAKLDRWRGIAFRGSRVQLQSRQQRSLTRQFPDVVQAVAEQLPAGTVVDGELVAMRDGRVRLHRPDLPRRMPVPGGLRRPC